MRPPYLEEQNDTRHENRHDDIYNYNRAPIMDQERYEKIGERFPDQERYVNGPPCLNLNHSRDNTENISKSVNVFNTPEDDIIAQINPHKQNTKMYKTHYVDPENPEHIIEN